MDHWRHSECPIWILSKSIGSHLFLKGRQLGTGTMEYVAWFLGVLPMRSRIMFDTYLHIMLKWRNWKKTIRWLTNTFWKADSLFGFARTTHLAVSQSTKQWQRLSIMTRRHLVDTRLAWSQRQFQSTTCCRTLKHMYKTIACFSGIQIPWAWPSRPSGISYLEGLKWCPVHKSKCWKATGSILSKCLPINWWVFHLVS